MNDEARFLVSDRFYVDRHDETLIVERSPVPLHQKAYQVLIALMTRPNALVTKRELFEEVWGTLAVSDAVLTTAIKELRQALGDDARAPWAIATVHGRGYRLMVNVQASDKPAPAASREGAGVIEKRFAGRRAVLALVALVALGAGALTLTPPFFGGAPASAAAPSIAVLPFNDYSRDAGHEWFGNSLAEEILNSLAQSQDLLVAARTSSFRYGKEADADIQEIADALDVSHVIEGSVQWEADQVRVTAQLIRAEDGFHVWSKSYYFPLATSDVMSLQRDIAEDIMSALNVGILGAREVSVEQPIRLEYYEHFIRGRELVMLRRPDSILAGLEELKMLIQGVPDFGPGHAWLAYAYMFSAHLSGRPSEDASKAAQFHVSRAMQLDPNSADTLTAAALLELARSNTDQALAYADRAVAANPNHVPALRRRGVILLMKGRAEEAHRDFLAVRARDPLSSITLSHVAMTFAILGDADRSTEAALEGIRWNPGDALAHSTLGRRLAAVGNYAAAIEELEKAVAINPNESLSTMVLSILYWQVGLDHFISFAEESKTWPGRAASAFSAGDFERGLELVEAYELGSPLLRKATFYYWQGDMANAYIPAKRLAAQNSLAEGGLAYSYQTGTIPVMLVMEANGDPQHELLRQRLEKLFADREPGDLAFGPDIYGAASWRMVNGEGDDALAWLKDAGERGFIFRELYLDPVWDPLRDSLEFQAILAVMEERAAAIRSEIEAGETEEKN